MRRGTFGMMGVDYEQRVDFDRLRRERVAKIKTELDKTDFSCLLLFDTGNKRYATATAVASPEVDNMGRYAIVPRTGEPIGLIRRRFACRLSSTGELYLSSVPLDDPVRFLSRSPKPRHPLAFARGDAYVADYLQRPQSDNGRYAHGRA